jgi:hypothetical protein
MPRNGSGVYSVPAGTTATPNTPIESAKYNAFVADLTNDLNLARPIVAGGTGATTKSGAQQALDLEPGVDIQAYNAKLAALAALTLAADKLIYATGSDTLATSDLTTFARTLLAGVDAAAMRTTLGLGDMSTKDDVAISDIDTTGAPSGNTILYGDGVWRQVGRLSYSNVTGSRAINTTYTNSTGRIMSVRIIGVTTLANTDIRIDTSYGAADMLAMGNGLNGIAFSLQADVPPGDTYRLQTYSGGATINVWLEGLL